MEKLDIQTALKMPIGISFADKDYKNNAMIYEAIKDLAEAKLISTGYAHEMYEVKETTNTKLTDTQKALIADKGNLCFGFAVIDNKIKIYTD